MISTNSLKSDVRFFFLGIMTYGTFKGMRFCFGVMAMLMFSMITLDLH